MEHTKTRLSRVSLLMMATLLIISLTGSFGCQNTDQSEQVTIQTKKTRLKVATTTSLYDSGLWGYLEPMFEQEYNVELDVLYAGTGKALEWGERGDVDAITVHSKARELAFVAEGHGLDRIPFAYNYFLIVGPESDPAGIKGMSPEDAFKALLERGQADPATVKFVSRGDNSGTHGKEKAVWKSAGYSYEDIQDSGEWYIEAGGGMGPILVMANEKQAYTLTDIATFLSIKADLDLVSVADKGEALINVYSVIEVNPDKKTNAELAEKLVEFLTSDKVQKIIGAYGVEEHGQQLFVPAAGQDL